MIAILNCISLIKFWLSIDPLLRFMMILAMPRSLEIGGRSNEGILMLEVFLLAGVGDVDGVEVAVEVASFIHVDVIATMSYEDYSNNNE